jgi:phenylalanyl-tRNA synthetase beta chain
MKVTLNWLKQYVDFNWSVEETVERLTMLGLEVEGVQKISGAFDGIVVAQVITRDKHPGADKLSLCKVNDGIGRTPDRLRRAEFQGGRQSPAHPARRVAAAEARRQRTVHHQGRQDSRRRVHGMLCSHEELGLDPEAIGHKKEDGLLILREDAKVGQPFGEYLGRSSGDVVFDLEVTPNRPDLNSVIGIAREIAAITGNPNCDCQRSDVRSQKSEPKVWFQFASKTQRIARATPPASSKA